MEFIDYAMPGGLVVTAILLWRWRNRCVRCNSWFSAFNWRDVTADVSHPSYFPPHNNHNQYCFRCGKWTAVDMYGQTGVLRKYIAEKHYERRHKRA